MQDINSQSGALKGSVDRLISQNARTSSASTSSDRLLASPLDIAQRADLSTGIVQTQVMARMIPGPALYHAVLGHRDGMAHKRIVPLQFLLKGWGDAAKGFQCYVHSISEDVQETGTSEDIVRLNSRRTGSYYYVGITGRNWLLRLNEHLKEMATGSRRRFYQAWREHYGVSGVLFTSMLKEVNRTYDEAMNWEEEAVDKIASDEFGLNMIPGGYKGIRFLHKCRIIENVDISPEAREHAIAEYFRRNPRKGLPNPFIAELWKSDDFYLKVIEAKEKTLTSGQVKKIRTLHAQGRTLSQIVEEVGALNEQQVRNVITGRTYRRVASS
ncbi:hypothetical protein P3G55_19410 [Leptospira sp. 96542]|nr:hypothetical protein [Leptospira sp. 96542]